MPNTPTALYLQGGPGINCAVERAWFGDTCPVLWWDQPRFPANADNAYQATLNAAVEKLAELVARQGQPIHVIGWSFGARLALDLAHRHPEAIGALTLLAPTFCLETSFDRLARHLRTQNLIDEAPKAATVAHAGDHTSFMRQAMALLSLPDLFSHYWAPASHTLFERHAARTSRADWFDLPTFTAVTREVIQHKPRPLPRGQVSQIRILTGRHDPYFDPESGVAFWKGLLPGSSIQIVDGSHMIPFELDVAEYLRT